MTWKKITFILIFIFLLFLNLKGANTESDPPLKETITINSSYQAYPVNYVGEFEYYHKKFNNNSNVIISADKEFTCNWYANSDNVICESVITVENKNSFTPTVNINNLKITFDKSKTYNLTYSDTYTESFDLLNYDYEQFENDTNIIDSYFYKYYIDKDFSNFKSMPTTVDTSKPFAIKLTYVGKRYEQNNYTFEAKLGGNTISLDPLQSSCGTLSSAGVYNLTQNVNSSGTCFTINGNNVVLDCQGYSINHSQVSPTTYGVYFSGNGNITVKNCKFTVGNTSITSGYSMYLPTGNHNHTIWNNTFYSQARNAYMILGQSLKDSNISNNYLEMTSETRQDYTFMYFDKLNNSVVNNNIINGSNGGRGKKGIYCANCGNNRVSNNYVNIQGNYSSILGIDFASGGSHNNITFNTIILNGTDNNYGISISSVITNNSISNNNITIRPEGNTNAGIFLQSASNVTVHHNIINFQSVINAYGIYSITTNNNIKILDNNISTPTDPRGLGNSGIYFTNTFNSSEITGNIINVSGVQSQYGFYLDITHSLISNNSIYTYGTGGTQNYGLTITTGVGNNTITNNKVKTYGTNQNYALYILNSNNNIIRENNFTSTGTGTSNYAVYINNVTASFVRNNLFDNNRIVHEEGSGVGIFINSRIENNTFLNNYIYSINRTLITDNVQNKVQQNYLIYNNSYGEIKWTSTSFLTNLTLNISNDQGFGLGYNLFIDNNTVALNSSAFYRSWINSSANITMNKLGLSTIKTINKYPDYQTTSAYEYVSENCLGTTCYNFSYVGGTLIFNTSSFSTFSASDSMCGTLLNSYTLTENAISNGTCFTIGANNVNLNCNNSQVNYSTQNIGYGVDNSAGYDNITIRNCFINQVNLSSNLLNSRAIQLFDSENNTIFNNTIRTFSTNAVYLNTTSRNNFTQNYLFNNASSSNVIFINATTYSTFFNNTFLNYGVGTFHWGFTNYNSENNIISNNIISTNGTTTQNYGLTFYNGNNNTVANNIINTNGTSTNYAIFTQSSRDSIYYMNDITTRGTGADYGIYIQGNDNNISSNNIETGILGNNNYGILVNNANNTITQNNNVSTTGNNQANYGIYYLSSRNGKIENNLIYTYGTSANYGLQFNGIDNITVNKNIIYTNGTSSSNYGLSTTGTSNSTFTNNYVVANGTTSNFGLYVQNSYSNIFDNNSINTKGWTSNYALYIMNTTSSNSDNNYFYGNVFNSTETLNHTNDAIHIATRVTENYFINNEIIAGNGYTINNEYAEYTNYLMYNNSYGEIKWTDNNFLKSLKMNVTNDRGLGLNRNIFIGNNSIAINSSAFISDYINSSLNLTLSRLGLSAVREIKFTSNYTEASQDILNSGTGCIGIQCYYKSYVGGILQFNSTDIGSFSADQEMKYLNATVKNYSIEWIKINWSTYAPIAEVDYSDNNITFNNVQLINYSGKEAGATYLNENQTYYLRYRYNFLNPYQYITQGTLEGGINNAPVTIIYWINSSNNKNTTNEDIIIKYNTTDADNDFTITYFDWYVNGSLYLTNTENNYFRAGNLTQGQNVSACARGYDGDAYSAVVCSRNLTVVSINSSTNFTFNYQIPADINYLNLINNNLNLSYNLTNYYGIDYANLYFNVNTSNGIFIYINGSKVAYGNVTTEEKYNVSQTYNFIVEDELVYPATYNYDLEVMKNIPHGVELLQSQNQWIKIELLNVSSQTQFNLVEMMVNSSPSAIQGDYVYCNKSYTSGNPKLSSYCTEFANPLPTTTFNHSHSEYSKHQAVFMAINTTSGKVGNVVVTSQSYFLRQGSSVTYPRDVYYITNTSRPTASATTNNNGATWTAQTYTVDMHLHQYNSQDAFCYYVNAISFAGNNETSGTRCDLIELGNQPPSSPNIYHPANSTYSGSYLYINYTAALSPNSYHIVQYNITLFNSTFGYNMSIKENNSMNLSYIWNITDVVNGQYIIKVQACDENRLCSYGESELFALDYNLTTLLYISIENYSVEWIKVNWTTLSTDAQIDISLDNITFISFNYLNLSGKNALALFLKENTKYYIRGRYNTINPYEYLTQRTKEGGEIEMNNLAVVTVLVFFGILFIVIGAILIIINRKDKDEQTDH